MKVKTLLVGGGVAANSALRSSLQIQAKTRGVDVFFPPMELCLDNAAMVAGLGFHWRRNSLFLGELERVGKSIGD